MNADYGAAGNLKVPFPTRKKSRDVCDVSGAYMFDLVRAIIIPVATFAAVNYIRAIPEHLPEMVSILLCILILVFDKFCCLQMDFKMVAIMICDPCGLWRYIFRSREPLTYPKQKFRLAGFVFCMSVVAWVLAFTLGTYNYKENFEPYYDIMSLNKYPAVDPSVYHGQQLMDAGQVEFIPGSHLDLSKSYGFKNGHTYCIAPIVAPTFKGPKKNMDNYDFWAVGLDCCSGHTSDFHCGEYANTNAHKGLRLMRDSERNYFRLAVKGATAAFGLRANYPIFMYFMSEPEAEIQAHYDTGMRNFVNSILGFTIMQSVLVFFAALYFDNWDAKDSLAGAAV